jgi:hypothetical protein
MQRHSDYDPATTAGIAAITGMVAGDRVFNTTTGQPNYRSGAGAWERFIVVDDGQVAFPVGAAAAPSITFDGDLDTGVYWRAANTIGLATNGNDRLYISDFQIVSAIDGTAAVPAITWDGDGNTGLFHPAADQVGITCGGGLKVDVRTDRFLVQPVGTVRFEVYNSNVRVSNGVPFYVNDAANSFQTIGITINQAGNDDEIISLKSSDVNHQFTAYTEADTYGLFDKVSGSAGGLDIGGVNESVGNSPGLQLGGAMETINTGKSTGDIACVVLLASQLGGANDRTTVAANGNLVAVRNWATTVTIIDAEGSLHVDLGGNGTAAAPSITVGADVGSGIFRHAVNNIGVAVGGNPIVISNAAITLAGGGDTPGGNIFIKAEDGGAATAIGQDGATITQTAGDGSASGGGGTDGGDGGDHRIQSGLGESASGAGVDGVDGLVFIEKSDESGFWDDLRIVPGAFDFAGSSDPTLSAWQPTGSGATFRVYEFDSGDEVFFTVQIPHTYKEGTNLMAHVHWTPRARGVAENGNTVFWRLDYSLTNVDANFPASSTQNLHDTCTGVNEKHEITSSQSISGVGVTISAMLVCRLYRAAGDTWSLNTAGNRPVLLEIDFHYQKNSTGSRAESVK